MKLTQKRMARPNLAGLLATRRGALTLALVSALAAAGVLVFAMGQYKTSLQSGAKQDTVLVATGLIKKGTSGATIAAEKLFRSTPVLATGVTPGAVSDSGFLNGSVAQRDILPGQQLTAAEFTTVAGVGGQLAPNERAVSVSIDEAHGDTDVVQAGDRVDVYAALSDKGSPVLTLLIAGALVIKPSGPTASSAGGPAGASLVLAVSTVEAPMLAFAADNGKLWIMLRPADASPPSPAPTTLNSILSSSTSTTTGTNP